MYPTNYLRFRLTKDLSDQRKVPRLVTVNSGGYVVLEQWFVQDLADQHKHPSDYFCEERGEWRPVEIDTWIQPEEGGPL
jgi:hypothetical protein